MNKQQPTNSQPIQNPDVEMLPPMAHAKVTKSLQEKIDVETHTLPYKRSAFSELNRPPTESQIMVEQGEAKISNTCLFSLFASSCMYLAFVNKDKGRVGLAHISSESTAEGFIKTWREKIGIEGTDVYLVKGNGMSEERSHSTFMTDTKKQLKDEGFQNIVEDFEKPVEGEPAGLRGEGFSNIYVDPHGTVKVERYGDIQKPGILYRLTPDKPKVLQTNHSFRKNRL